MEREGKLIDEKKNCKQGVIIMREKQTEMEEVRKEGVCNEVFAHCISLGHINKL